MRIAVDFMGDNPEEIIKGANTASDYNPEKEIIVVGPEDIKPKLRGPTFQLAPDFIKMGENIGAFRRRSNTSINVVCTMVRDSEASALVSAGNSKATVWVAMKTLGMLKGIKRPAIAVILPSQTGKTILIDAGATVDAEPEWLLRWAILGSIYASVFLEKITPRVGLLNVGEEEDKGDQLRKSCYLLFGKSPGINFVGNVENIFQGEADVVVCDGFVGNVVLKTAEGIMDLFDKGTHEEADYAFHGGALLLGVSGIVVIAHGKSSARAIERAIDMAIELVGKNIIVKIQEILKSRE